MGASLRNYMLCDRRTMHPLVFYYVTYTRVGPSTLLIYGPLLVGVTGIIFGIISQRWYLIVLNVLPPLVFPAIMFFGTLILGP